MMTVIFHSYSSITSPLLFAAIFVLWMKYKSSPSDLLFKILIISLFLLFLFHILLYNTDAEDAYISFRYARKLVSGKGLVFNNSEYVEGYSNFLWIIILACLNFITTVDIPVLGRILSLFFSYLTVLLGFVIITRLTAAKISKLYIVLLISSSGVFACYGLAGLETPLYSFLLLMSCLLLFKSKWFLCGVMISLAAMTRPEGYLLVFSSIIYVVYAKRKSSLIEKLHSILWIMIGMFVIAIPWNLWRLFYYGYFLPNTLAAKSGMGLTKQILDGIQYFNGFITVSSPILVLMLFILARILLDRKKKIWIFNSYNTFFTSTILIFSLFYIVVGGDWMPAWRFFAPLIPIITVFTVYLWFKYPPIKSYVNAKFVIPSIFLICGYLMMLNSFTNSNMLAAERSWRTSVQQLKILGKWFSSALPTNIVVVAYANGVFSYYFDNRIIDPWGLTDEHIARHGNKYKNGVSGHISYDYDYILKQKPDIILFTQGIGLTDRPVLWPEIDSSASENYTNVTFVYGKPVIANNKYASFYIRNSEKDFIIEKLLKANDNFKLLSVNEIKY